MSKNMLGNPAELQRFIAGPIADLVGKAAGKNGGYWQSAVKKLARGERDPFGPGTYILDVDYKSPKLPPMMFLNAHGFDVLTPGVVIGSHGKTEGIEEVVFKTLYFNGEMTTREGVTRYIADRNMAFLNLPEIISFFIKCPQVLDEFNVIAFVAGSEDGKKIGGEFFFQVKTVAPDSLYPGRCVRKGGQKIVNFFEVGETYPGEKDHSEFNSEYRFLVKEV